MATNRFTYDFNSLTDGTLDGQGGWALWNGSNLVYVSGSYPYEGAKGLRRASNDSGSGANYSHALDSSGQTGEVWFYFYGESGMNANDNTISTNFDVLDGNPTDLTEFIAHYCSRIGIRYLSATDNFDLRINSGGSWNNVATFSKAAWHKIKLEWDSTKGTYGQSKVILDDTTDSGWYEFVSNHKDANITYLNLYSDAAGASGSGKYRYWDSFGYTYVPPVVNSGFLDFMGSPQPQI